MSWKAIGGSATGTSHTTVGKGCEDALAYKTVIDAGGNEVLICAASDGAGSALFAAEAASRAAGFVTSALEKLISDGHVITESSMFSVFEELYDLLDEKTRAEEADLSEFSCTLLGCCISAGQSVFFQLGDGAIVRGNADGFYTTVWWPHNGEYQNTTAFVVDDRNMPHLQVVILEETIDEVAIFTDGLQLLALNTETRQVHQPFFTALFPHLRMADTTAKTGILNNKLAAYLDSKAINDRTDDDKTLFLATRL